MFPVGDEGCWIHDPNTKRGLVLRNPLFINTFQYSCPPRVKQKQTISPPDDTCLIRA